MAILRVNCPECDTAIRKTIDAVDEPTEFTLRCPNPKCRAEFTAEVEPEAPQVRASTKKSVGTGKKSGKASRRRDSAGDDNPSKKKMILGGVAAGILLLGGVMAAVISMSGSKSKPDETAKNGDTAPVFEPKIVTPAPKGGGPKGNPAPGNGGLIPGVISPNPNPGKNPPPKLQDPDDDLPPGVSLPPPPVVRVGKSLAVEQTAPIARPPAAPPLLPDEDPFVRSKGFHVEGALPPLPKLPPLKERPLLNLDSGGHSALVKNAFITPKGDRVVTVGEDKAVRIWDIRSREILHTIRLPAGPGDEGALQAAALAPNGKRLAVSGIPLKGLKPGTYPIFILDVDTGALVKTISAASEIVESLDFSADGNKLAAGCIDGVVQLFDVNTGRKTDDVSAHRAPIREVRFNPRAKILATLGLDSTVKIWNLTNAARSVSLSITGLGPTTLAWSGDGRTLAVGGMNGEIMLFTVEGQHTRTLPARKIEGETVGVQRIQFLASDASLVYCGVGGKAQGWAGVISAANGETRVSFTGHNNTVFCVNVSADGTRAVSSGGNQNEAFVWSTADGKVIARLAGSGQGVWGIGWANDGKSIAWGTSNLRKGDGHTTLEGLFRFDDFGLGSQLDESKYQQAVMNDPKGAVKIERLSRTELGVEPTGKQPYIYKLPGGDTIYAATVLPGRSGKVVVCGAFNLILLDTQTGQTLRNYVGHVGHILSVSPSPDGLYFLTGSADQTMRIWMPELDEPVMSLFVGGREWIAWTPMGYYACSAYGERLVAWQINNTGKDAAYKLPAVHPAERFRSSMYQPAVIKYLVPAGNVQFALAMAQKFDQALIQASSVAEVLPPEVELVTPIGETERIDGNTVSVKAVARGSVKQPITRMRLLVDGRPFQGAEGVVKFAEPQATAEATWQVPVLPGPHSFAVIAESTVSKGMSKGAVVTRSGTPPKPNLYVLTMGVSAYPGDMKLNYAASDATLLAKTFQEKSKGVFNEIEVKVLTDSQATKKNMQDALDWLASKMTAKDVGIVSFSGHGTRDGAGRFYFVPVDVSDDDPIGTCFAGDEFKRRLENMPGRLVAILDACHSGAVADITRPQARADGLVRDLVSEDAGVVVMCSSLGAEYSIESRLTKAGFFTLGLVEGMSGHGDVDQDGIIFIHELDLYAGVRVRQLSGGRQNPTIGRPPSIRPFPIASIENSP